ncbi:MAG: M23 family metallopeptidase [Verrucomicrobia bacterium]|nr:M23 family metallopeptidase [Verrucomicrobiota bacterium]
MSKTASNGLLCLTLLIAAGVVGVVLWRAGQGPGHQVERVGFQDADAPLMMPEAGEVDERFDFPSAWQRAQIPQAARFDPPLGSDHGGFTYNAQGFWEMNDGRGGRHLGDDLNGIGGMNTDQGDPVFATADGLVVYAGEPSPGWGKVVVLAHRTAESTVLQSMYAHLERIEVVPGALVARGSRLGTVGTAHGNYPAHLHFEMRASDALSIGAGYAMQQLDRLDPSATVAALRHAAPEDRSPAVLACLLVPNDNPWSGVETKDAKGAERLMEILGKEPTR